MSDFSDRGFELRSVDSNKVNKKFSVSRMWIGKVGWSQGVKKNIIRVYDNGFSFWRGHEKDQQEWFCEFSKIISFSQPLNIKSASPIIRIKVGGGSIDCMLGQATDYIRDCSGGL